ncbi:MAG TPA: inositol monophosphatase family protein [Egibacteraceae bacterium]|nr:inositol monophosphatase family protein [Egibacteraceae bacterium]
MNLAELRDFALGLADHADRISLAAFADPGRADAKVDGSPVTAADRAVEQSLRERIADRWPGHALLGEEHGGAIAPDRPTWVLDPIDATKNFLRGVPVFATLIALVVGGRAVVGVASAPAMGERWDAAAGLGARCNGRPVAVSAVADLSSAHVLHGGLEWFRRAALWDALGALADAAWRTRGFGDFWMYLLVAGGMADVAVEADLRPWDVAALECIVTEAGGRLTAFDGGPAIGSGEALATNGLLHDELVARLSGRDGA